MLAAARRLSRTSLLAAMVCIAMAFGLVMHLLVDLRCGALEAGLAFRAETPDYPAARALAGLGRPGRDCLLHALASGDAAHQAAAAYGLSECAEHADDEVVAALAVAAEHGAEIVSFDASSALGTIGPDALPAASALLRAGSRHGRRTRAAAAQALADMGIDVLPALADGVTARAAAERETAVMAVGILGPEAGAQVAPAIYDRLTDESPMVRALAARAWLALPGAENGPAVEALVSAMASGDADAAVCAVATVSCFGVRVATVLEVLRVLAERGDTLVSGMAAQTLASLTRRRAAAPMGARG
jgi:hypothetical protein